MDESYSISYIQKENKDFIKERIQVSLLGLLLMHKIQAHWVEQVGDI